MDMIRHKCTGEPENKTNEKCITKCQWTKNNKLVIYITFII